MHIPQDLDPVDAVVRKTLIDTLRLSREARGITTRQVADLLGTAKPAVPSLERRTTWGSRTITRYARTIGWRIEWLMHDLAVPDDGDVMALILSAANTSTPESADRVHWRIFCYDLTRIRRASCTAAEMARRLRVTESAVFYWEANPDGASVNSAQRHARALGGVLGWRLHEVSTPLHPHAPVQRSAA